jgi:hypothetical protein
MPRVVITAHVEDLVIWEKGFRSHGSHFKHQTVSTPINSATIGLSSGDLRAICQAEAGDEVVGTRHVACGDGARPNGRMAPMRGVPIARGTVASKVPPVTEVAQLCAGVAGGDAGIRTSGRQ